MANTPRETPASAEAEQALLSSAFQELNRTMTICAELGITSAHFHYPSHATYYDLLSEYWSENEPIEDVGFQQVLRDRGIFNQLGGRVQGQQLTGPSFFTAIRIFVGTAYNAENYARTVLEKFILREVIRITSAATANAYDYQDDIQGLLNGTVENMMKVVRIAEGQKTHSRTMRELVGLAIRAFEAEMAEPGKIEMPSGLPGLDLYTDGFVAPEVTVVMAKPSDGKTALSLNLAEHLAVNCGKRVGYISLEMSDVQLTRRMLFAMAGMDTRKIKRVGYITDEEHAAIVSASIKLSEAPIFIRDDGALTTNEISATAANWKAKHGLDILIVDHAQLAKASKETESRTSEVEQVSNAMKPIAKRLGIPIMLLSQVTEDARTGSYSAKNSKALEADADNIWTLSHTREKDEETGRMVITASWIRLDKQRDRERYITVPLIFHENIQRFTERNKDDSQPELVSMPPAKRRK